MRSTPVLVPVFLFCSVALAAHQGTTSQKTRTPKSGDTVVVKGCLRGGMLESTEIAVADDGDPLPSGHTFQLKGKKDLLKQLRQQHDGHLVEITGVLKSQLMDEAQRGTRIGKTRIVVGAESSMRGGVPPPSEALPVLEARAFEGFATTCRR
jgi:uncharacterized protein YdeI (BOF family)